MTDPRPTNDPQELVSAGGGEVAGAGGSGSVSLDGVRVTRGQQRSEAAATQQKVLLRFVRLIFVVLVLVVTLLQVIDFGTAAEPGLSFEMAARWEITLAGAALVAVVFILIDVFTPNKKISTFGGVMFGLVAGLIVTLALGFVIDLVAASWQAEDNPVVNGVKVLSGICLCFLGVTTVLQTQDDFRLVIPYVEFSKQIRGLRPMLLDTSVLIDARIVEVAETGALQAPLVVPSFVVNELQVLADSSDRLKRTKGRRGLHTIGRLRRSGKIGLTIDETPVAETSADQMLLELARELPAVIVTGDLALARIADFQGTPVVNINELATAMRPSLTPGEEIRAVIVKPGEQSGQGVAYLDDGTMVVCEDGGDQVGQEVEMRVRSALQTSAGRMIFARLASGDEDAEISEDVEEPEETGAAEDAGEAPVTAGRSAPARPRSKSPRGRNPRR